jgi:hypothetical protein
LYNRRPSSGVQQLFQQALPSVCVHARSTAAHHSPSAHSTPRAAGRHWAVEVLVDRMSNQITPRVYSHLLGLQARLAMELTAALRLLRSSLAPDAQTGGVAAPSVSASGSSSSPVAPTVPSLSADAAAARDSYAVRVVHKGVALRVSSAWAGGTQGAVLAVDTGVIAVEVALAPEPDSPWRGSVSFDALRASLSEPRSSHHPQAVADAAAAASGERPAASRRGLHATAASSSSLTALLPLSNSSAL